MKHKNKITLDTKVIFMDFENNKWEKECKDKTLGWFLEQMSIMKRRKDIMFGEWFLDADINTEWGKYSIMYALVSWLCWIHEFDDIFFRIEKHKVFIDRFSSYHQVLWKKHKEEQEHEH